MRIVWVLEHGTATSDFVLEYFHIRKESGDFTIRRDRIPFALENSFEPQLNIESSDILYKLRKLKTFFEQSVDIGIVHVTGGSAYSLSAASSCLAHMLALPQGKRLLIVSKFIEELKPVFSRLACLDNSLAYNRLLNDHTVMLESEVTSSVLDDLFRVEQSQTQFPRNR